ncbi:MAG: hypothetical protein MK105_00415 [Crocinitomicaceae bacterium]|nr:hypothetical protein [Crocinitomicaceae bacterium]
MRFVINILILTSIVLLSCQNNSKNRNTSNKTEVNSESIDIPFVVAKNYFVKNSIQQLDNPKIETQTKFNEIFGIATTMGKDGMATEIDFSKQYVIAVVKPETDLSATIEPVSLKKNEAGEVVFTYSYATGEKQTYSTRPNIAIILDKSENGDVVIREVK